MQQGVLDKTHTLITLQMKEMSEKNLLKNPEIVFWHANYLRAIQKYLQQKRDIIYFDETVIFLLGVILALTT